MTSGSVSRRIVLDRLDIVSQALDTIRELPLGELDDFLVDERNVWTAESCLRRALEALMDIGRHILAKGFGSGVTEYKQIVDALLKEGVLTLQEAKLMHEMAGYRNRLVHLYHEVTREELYSICVNDLDDVDLIQDAYRRWLRNHPDKLDEVL